MYYSNGNTIESNSCEGSDYAGISLEHSNSNTLSSNILKGNGYYGICLSFSSNNVLTNNTSLDSWRGILVGDWSNNNILSNNISMNNDTGIALFVESNGNTLSNNTISNNSTGISMSNGPSNNILESNRIENNQRGMDLDLVYGSLIYNNYFNNSTNIYFSGYISNNQWNIEKTLGTSIVGGPYLGGNYWATPDGTGFSQTHEDSDGDWICDEPYLIVAGNTDELPLTTHEVFIIENARFEPRSFNPNQGGRPRYGLICPMMRNW